MSDRVPAEKVDYKARWFFKGGESEDEGTGDKERHSEGALHTTLAPLINCQ